MLQDLRFALRAFRRQPGFALLAVFLIAIAAAANATVFSVVRAVLLAPLPYVRPDELVVVRPQGFVSNADIEFLRASAHSLAQVASVSPGWTMTMTGAGEAARVTATKTSANAFDLAGVPPLFGRTFAEGEAEPGRPRVAILSYALWRTHFGSDPHVVGRTVTLEGAPHEIVGVMPARFELLGRDAELWTPMVFDRASPFWKGTVSQCLARLRPGADLETARNELKALVPAWRRALGYKDDWGRDALVSPLRDEIVGDVRRPLLVLLGAVGLVVMLTAANIGTLLLGRQIGRRRETAVRGALGASPARLVRAAAVESLALAVIGATAGLLAAWVALPALVRMLPPEVPLIAGVSIDAGVLGVTIGVAAMSVLVFGTAPSLVAARAGLAPLTGMGRQTDSPSTRRTLGSLVVAQLALAVVLSVGAALMGRSLLALYAVNPGFDATHVLTLELQPTGERYRGVARTVAYYRDVLARVRALPGVEAAGAVNHLPLSGFNWTTTIRRDDQPLRPGVSPPTSEWRMIDGRYFDVMRIPLLAGREFTDDDMQASPPVAIVNDVFARRFFGSPAAALGRVVRTGSASGETTPTIVGVVGGVRHVALAVPPAPELYRPMAQSFAVASAIVIRTAGAPVALAPAARAAIRDVDPALPVADVRPLSMLLQDSLLAPRLLAILLLAFAAAGLAIVVSGAYGVVAYSVRRREREFGIRLAIGAAPAEIGRLVIRQGAIYAAAGVGIGLPIALLASGVMRGLLFGVAARDVPTFIAVGGVIAAVTIAATLAPAARAFRVKPATALRAD